MNVTLHALLKILSQIVTEKCNRKNLIAMQNRFSIQESSGFQGDFRAPRQMTRKNISNSSVESNQNQPPHKILILSPRKQYLYIEDRENSNPSGNYENYPPLDGEINQPST
jgi:hypothetical protein